MNINRLGQLTVVLLTGLGTVRATDAVFQNDGVLSAIDFSQIDAFIFINNGYFTAGTPSDLDYETQNTLYYTNRGTMTASPGFRFSTATPTGRHPAAVFNNQGNIEAVDSGSTLILPAPGGSSGYQIPVVSRLEVNATNIVNRGLLSAGQNGLIKLTGKTLDLSRGGFRTGVSPGGFNFDFSGIVNTNYHFNSSGIYDNYWGLGTNQVLGDPARGTLLSLQQTVSGFDTNIIYIPPDPHSPPHEVLYSGFSPALGTTVQIPFLLPDPGNLFKVFVKTNYNPGATNALNQLVYINTNIGNGTVTADVKWAGDRPVVRLAFTDYDPVLEANVESAIYMEDDMAVNTNHFYTTNIVYFTGRPNNYAVGRSLLVDWDTSPALARSTTPFNYRNQIFGAGQTLSMVTNLYSAYSFTVSQQPPAGSIVLPGNVFSSTLTTFLGTDFGYGFGFGALTDATNMPGRLEVDTDGTFDARYARFRSENYLSVKAKNFIYNTNTVFNSPVISMDLGSTNGTLGIAKLIPAAVSRLIGQVNMYSALWTNYSTISPLNTNLLSIVTHVWIIDDTAISASQPVDVQNVTLRADNITLQNNISVSKGLVMDGTNVTVASDLVVNGLTDSANNITAANFPSLKNFVINDNGRVIVGDDATFGSAESPLDTFVNNGTFFGYSADIHAHTFANTGTFGTGGALSGGGPTRINADTIDVNFGSFLVGGDMTLTGQTLRCGLSSFRVGDISINFGGQEYVSLGALNLNISGTIEDGGANNWRVTDGFNLRRLPMTGDLQGTTITSRAGKFREIHHTWAGVDKGAVGTGYDNNGALQKLVLSGDRLPLFVFDTIDGNNALYVDYLQFDGEATNVQQNLVIMPGMKIYFDQSNLPVGQLDGLFADADAPAGRLVHVTNPNSTTLSVSVRDGVAGGVTQADLASNVIDSDGDGIPNAQDETPFDGVKIDVKLLSGSKPATAISWNGAARTEYQVQYRSAFSNAGWESLTNVITGSAPKLLTVQDPLGPAEERFYRVVYSP